MQYNKVTLESKGKDKMSREDVLQDLLGKLNAGVRASLSEQDMSKAVDDVMIVAECVDNCREFILNTLRTKAKGIPNSLLVMANIGMTMIDAVGGSAEPITGDLGKAAIYTMCDGLLKEMRSRLKEAEQRNNRSM